MELVCVQADKDKCVTSRHSIFLILLARLALLLGRSALLLRLLLGVLLGLGIPFHILLLLALHPFVAKHLALLVGSNDDIVDTLVEFFDDLDAGVDGKFGVQDTTPDAKLFKEKLRDG